MVKYLFLRILLDVGVFFVLLALFFFFSYSLPGCFQFGDSFGGTATFPWYCIVNSPFVLFGVSLFGMIIFDIKSPVRMKVRKV